MKKRKLTVTVVEPVDPDSFHRNVAEVMFEVWKDICPKELQLAAMDKALEKLKG